MYIIPLLAIIPYPATFDISNSKSLKAVVSEELGIFALHLEV